VKYYKLPSVAPFHKVKELRVVVEKDLGFEIVTGHVDEIVPHEVPAWEGALKLCEYHDWAEEHPPRERPPRAPNGRGVKTVVARGRGRGRGRGRQ
jgi:hypothetical protein